jgi:hypothetical protein
MKENLPKDSPYKIMMIQCSECGCVVGVSDYLNVPVILELLAKKLGVHLNK